MPSTIDNTQDLLDSRDIIERIEELEETLIDMYNENVPETMTIAEQGMEVFNKWIDSDDVKDLEEVIEYKTLKAFASELEGYGDWKHGETLIRESYFEEYAKELAYDVGAVNKDAKWPNNHIDWGAAAEELKADYTEAEFDGITYLMRA